MEECDITALADRMSSFFVHACTSFPMVTKPYRDLPENLQDFFATVSGTAATNADSLFKALILEFSPDDSARRRFYNPFS